MQFPFMKIEITFQWAEHNTQRGTSTCTLTNVNDVNIIRYCTSITIRTEC